MNDRERSLYVFFQDACHSVNIYFMGASKQASKRMQKQLKDQLTQIRQSVDRMS